MIAPGGDGDQVAEVQGGRGLRAPINQAAVRLKGQAVAKSRSDGDGIRRGTALVLW